MDDKSCFKVVIETMSKQMEKLCFREILRYYNISNNLKPNNKNQNKKYFYIENKEKGL